MENYKPNSKRYKEQQKDVQEKRAGKVVKGAVKIKKKNQLADVFISEDVTNVKNYVIMDVLVPAIKNAVADIVTDGIGMILFGESGRRGRGRSSSSSQVAYNSYYSGRNDDRRGGRDYDSSRTRPRLDNIILESRGEAEEVLTSMDEILDTYEIVRVADLYDLIGVSGTSTDNNYGWDSLRTAEVIRVRDGYLLKLPRPKAIR